MKRLMLLLGAVAVLAVAMTARSGFSEGTETEILDLKKDVRAILERQDEILKQIETIKDELKIIKIRCNG